jgi:hypothetical protein
VSGYRWGVSLLILYHLTAVGVGLLPVPADLPSIPSDRPRTIVDLAAAALARVERTLYVWSAPARALTYPYREAGLRQKWDMFAAPKAADQYVRLDHLVVDRVAGRRRIVSELVLPAQPDDQLRLRHDFRDKAIINALDAFLLRTARTGQRSGPARDAARNDLGPVVRYFSSRLRDRLRPGDETIARTELWYGRAPIPPPGQALAAETRDARAQALRAYASERTSSAAADPDARPIGTDQRDADIVWTLEYVEWR